VIPANDRAALESTIADAGHEIAAMIFEPTGAHWGTDPLDLNYARHARELTAERGIVLIFDEVITGFRVSPGGAQQVYGITPDLTTMAKIVAGGLPGGCVGGRAEIIDQIAAREGPRVSHPGTFNANPLSAAAGAACLETIADGAHQARADRTAAAIARGMNAAFTEEAVAGAVYGQSSMLHVALGATMQPPDGYTWGWNAVPVPLPAGNTEAAHALHLGMLNEGVHLMAGGMMVSSAHGDADVDRTIEAFRRTIRALKEERLI
jgi:glutamate-1-semialdehyde 2,1-aminomutase